MKFEKFEINIIIDHYEKEREALYNMAMRYRIAGLYDRASRLYDECDDIDERLFYLMKFRDEEC